MTKDDEWLDGDEMRERIVQNRVRHFEAQKKDYFWDGQKKYDSLVEEIDRSYARYKENCSQTGRTPVDQISFLDKPVNYDGSEWSARIRKWWNTMKDRVCVFLARWQFWV